MVDILGNIYFTNINIHAHPGLPLIPSILSIAAASNPEKAPDKDAAEAKRDILEKIRYSTRLLMKQDDYRNDNSLLV